MGEAESHQPSVLELARSGNARAIAYWLNVFLLPHNLFAQAEAAAQPDRVRVLVEFHAAPDVDPKSPEFRRNLVQFICHHIWKLNSSAIDGVQIVTRYVGTPQILWQQAVRVVSPARRAKLAQSAPKSTAEVAHLKTRIRQVTRQKVQFRALRSLLMTGTTAAAFIIGCWLGYADSPSDQKTATATNSGVTTRSDTVATVLEPVRVEKATAHSTDGTATLMFAGDVGLTNSYADVVGSDHKWAFSALEEVRQADVAIVSLEAPFTTASTPLSSRNDPFKADPANVEVLKNGGIDLVNLANNRVMDYQGAGLEDTLKTLDQAGIHHFGAGRDAKEARRPEILDVAGQRVAYLGYYDSDLQAAGDGKPGTNAKQNDRISADIKAIRNQVDWIVVNFHWGDELSKYPGDWQIELARFSIDQGADLVVGHHSSVLQGAEVYKGRPIVYSLGNFIFGAQGKSDYDTAMLKVALKDRQMKVELLPVEVKGFQPRVVDGDRAKEILRQIENVSDGFHQPLKSPIVIDARSNTVISQPEANPANRSGDQPASDSQEPVQPATPESTAAPTPTQPATPDSTATPSPSTQPESSEPTPAASPTEQPEAPTPSSSPTPQQSDQPWNDNSFISPTTSPTPTMPTPNPEASQAPTSPQTNAGEAVRPVNSLEPLKRRYAQLPSIAGR